MLPTSASTSRSCTSSPNRARTSRPIESASIDVRGRNGSSAGAGLAPPGEQPGRGERCEMPGHAEQEAVGDPVQRVVPDRGVHRFGRHQLPRRGRPPPPVPCASGTRARKASAPLSIMSNPAKAVPPIRPPGRSDVSNTVTSSGVALANSHAAASPVIPPPTTATRPCFIDVAVIDSPWRPRSPVGERGHHVGSALTLAVRSKASPARSARCAASMSRSYSTSR